MNLGKILKQLGAALLVASLSSFLFMEAQLVAAIVIFLVMMTFLTRAWFYVVGFLFSLFGGTIVDEMKVGNDGATPSGKMIRGFLAQKNWKKHTLIDFYTGGFKVSDWTTNSPGDEPGDIAWSKVVVYPWGRISWR